VGKNEQTNACHEKVRKNWIKFNTFLILVLFSYGCSYIPNIALLTTDPLTAEEHNNLGVAYEKEGKYDLALREYKRAVDRDRTLVVPLVNMANVYYKQGKYEQAEENYLKALKKDEKNIEAANNLASLYITLNKNYYKGLKYLTQAIPSLDDSPAYALDTLGVLYFRVGDRSKAKKVLLRACQKLGEDDQLLLEEIELHLRELGEQGCPEIIKEPVSMEGSPATVPLPKML
jgi:Tfp pilus assembly protein PilF